MKDYPPEFDEEHFDNQFFAEAFPDADSPAELYRQLYKYTDCGPYLSVRITYFEEIEPDGFNDFPADREVSKWIDCGELSQLGTWKEMDERGELITAMLVGSIVEGVDFGTDDIEVETTQDEEPADFAKRLYAAVNEVNDEANSIWHDTHGCKTCAKHFKIDLDEEMSPVWTHCPDCGGDGVSI